jgi:hypothetical protein
MKPFSLTFKMIDIGNTDDFYQLIRLPSRKYRIQEKKYIYHDESHYGLKIESST